MRNSINIQVNVDQYITDLGQIIQRIDLKITMVKKFETIYLKAILKTCMRPLYHDNSCENQQIFAKYLKLSMEERTEKSRPPLYT